MFMGIGKPQTFDNSKNSVVGKDCQLLTTESQSCGYVVSRMVSRSILYATRPSWPLVGESVDEMKTDFGQQRDNEFESHVCAEHPRAR
jgi:hypothetical protein